jgi:hypothetical protein
MFKMSQFEPISGKKAKGIALGLFFKYRYIFLILTVAISRHTIKIIYFFD